MDIEERSLARPVGAGVVPAWAFRLIVDGTAAPFVLVDRAGTIRYASGSLPDVIGWAPEELLGRNMAEFLPEDQIELAVVAIAEIDRVNRAGNGVPIVFAVARPDGTRAWVEVGAMPFLDVPELDCIALRLRPWDAEHHLAELLEALLSTPTTAAVLPPLARSIAATVQAAGAAVHHGFDGRSFLGTTGSWPGASSLRLDDGPWCAALGQDDDLVTVDAPAGGPAGGDAACWLVPVRGEGRAPAVVSVWRRQPGEPLVGHRHALARLSRYVSLALVRTAEHQRLLHLAGHDALTGVANRVTFRDRLAHALAIGERDLAVAFVDLDRFKPVNDTHGHQVGDRVLVEVAGRLRSALRVGDELARLGGDEFTALLRNVPDETAVGHVADRLLRAVEEPFDVPGGTASIGLSVGIALARTGASADDLLVAADAALYQAKRAGGRRWAVSR